MCIWDIQIPIEEISVLVNRRGQNNEQPQATPRNIISQLFIFTQMYDVFIHEAHYERIKYYTEGRQQLKHQMQLSYCTGKDFHIRKWNTWLIVMIIIIIIIIYLLHLAESFLRS